MPGIQDYGDLRRGLDFVMALPPFTRSWLLATIALTFLGRLGIPSSQWLVLAAGEVLHKFNFWRPVTALFYFPLTPQTGFRFLSSLYLLYHYSSQLETGDFAGRPADYFFMLLFNWACCVAVGLGTSLLSVMEPMVWSVLYIWCQLNRDSLVTHWFGGSFRAVYLPWALLALNTITTGSGMSELVGILVGHAYYFLRHRYPDDFNGPRLLATPALLYEWFPNNHMVAGSGSARVGSSFPDVGFCLRGRRWGPGRKLGGK